MSGEGDMSERLARLEERLNAKDEEVVVLRGAVANLTHRLDNAEEQIQHLKSSASKGECIASNRETLFWAYSVVARQRVVQSRAGELAPKSISSPCLRLPEDNLDRTVQEKRFTSSLLRRPSN